MNLTSDFTATTLTIPATIKLGENTITVTQIGDNTKSIAYGGVSNNTITTVTFSADVTITNNAFRKFTALKTVNLANKVTAIGNLAFAECASLTAVNNVNALTTIGTNAFSDCTSLVSFSGPNVTKLGTTAAGVFKGCTALRNLMLTNKNLQIYNGSSYTSTFKREDIKAQRNCMIYLNASVTLASGEYNIVQSKQCADFRIFEGDDYGYPARTATVTDYDFKAAKVTYNRQLAKNGIYTIFLPYAAPAIDGVKYYELSEVDGTTVKFTEVANPEARKPYLVTTSTKNVYLNIESGSTDVSGISVGGNTTADGYRLSGRLLQLSPANTVGKYILQAGGKWQKAQTENASVYVPPFRAYIEATGSGAPALDSTFGSDDNSGTTAIENIRTVSADGTQHYYDLQGRPLTAPQRGINIVNGKKVLMK